MGLRVTQIAALAMWVLGNVVFRLRTRLLFTRDLSKNVDVCWDFGFSEGGAGVVSHVYLGVSIGSCNFDAFWEELGWYKRVVIVSCSMRDRILCHSSSPHVPRRTEPS